MQKARVLVFFGVCFSILWVAGCGDTTSGSSGSGTSSTATPVTVSGQVAVSAVDLQLAQNTSTILTSPRLKGEADEKSVRPSFQTVADSVLPQASISLVKIKADGTKEAVSGVTATTDNSGNFKLEGVPASILGTGKVSDYYYEVRATRGSVVVSAPAAPTTTSTVNLSPETKIATKMLTDVAKIPGTAASVLPRADVINQVRDLVKEDVASLGSNISVPSVRNSAESDVAITATAVASGGSNSEKILRTFEAEKEFQKLKNTGAQTAAVSSYMERVVKQACNFNPNFNLPTTARNALAQAFIDNKKVKVSDVVSAYNANNGTDPDVPVSQIVTATKTVLTDIESKVASKAAIPASEQHLLLTKRDVSASDFAHTTELETDQALSVVQGMFQQSCQAGNFDMVGFASAITGSDAPATASFVDVQVFHDSSGACTGNTGHLRAQTQVYAPAGITVSQVSLQVSGLSLKNAQLRNIGANGNFSRWELSNENQDSTCVTFGQSYDYTFTAQLSSASTVSGKVTRTHFKVPEASIKFAVTGDTLSKDMNSPTKTNAKRPIFEWSPKPGDAKSEIATAPDGSQIKFTFELAYIDKSDQQVAPLQQCGVGGSSQKLMDRNYFISDVNCDVQTCAAAAKRTAANVVCRTNVQTFLVDENDRILGQGAGNFGFYCVQGMAGCQ